MKLTNEIIQLALKSFTRWDEKIFLKTLEENKFTLHCNLFPASSVLYELIKEYPSEFWKNHGIWGLFNMYFGYDRYANYRTINIESLRYLLEKAFIKGFKPSYTQYPEKFLIELTQSCNLDCIMCGIGKYGYQQKFTIPLEIFHQIVDELLSDPRIKVVRLNGLGESLIIPNFLDYLKLLSDKNFRLEIFTNLHVPFEHIKVLLDKGARIYISADSPNPHTFEFIRRRSNFRLFVENLNKVVNYAKKLNMIDDIYVNMTILKINYRDVPEMVKFLAKHGIKNLLVTMVKEECGSPWVKSIREEIIKYFRIAEELADKLGVNIFLPDHLEGNKVEFRYSTETSNTHCECSLKEVVIRFNGDLTACNMMNPFTYGNIYLSLTKEYFLELWNGPNAIFLRSVLNTENKPWYCFNCYHYNPCIKP